MVYGFELTLLILKAFETEVLFDEWRFVIVMVKRLGRNMSFGRFGREV